MLAVPRLTTGGQTPTLRWVVGRSCKRLVRAGGFVSRCSDCLLVGGWLGQGHAAISASSAAFQAPHYLNLHVDIVCSLICTCCDRAGDG
jgi:hypothetical protein